MHEVNARVEHGDAHASTVNAQALNCGSADVGNSGGQVKLVLTDRQDLGDPRQAGQGRPLAGGHFDHQSVAALDQRGQSAATQAADLRGQCGLLLPQLRRVSALLVSAHLQARAFIAGNSGQRQVRHANEQLH